MDAGTRESRYIFTEISWFDAIVYALPVCAVSAPVFLIQTYFLNFATDVLLIAPATAGVLFAAVRVWDAVSDPIVGYWSDRSRNALGKRRPWMLVSAPMLPIACFAVWTPPVVDSSAELVAWVGASLFLFYTFATAWSVPHTALGIDLTRSEHVRRRVFGMRFVASIAGVIGAFTAMQLIVNDPSPRDAAQRLVLVSLPVLALVLLLPPSILSERTAPNKIFDRAGTVLRSLLRNANARALFLAWFLIQCGIFAQATVAPYMSLYIVERPDLIGILPACYIGAMIVSVPLWVRLGRHMAHAALLRWTLVCAGISYLPLLLLNSFNIWLAFVVLAFAGFFSGGMGPLAPALLASVVDEDERQHGQSRAATYSAAWELVEKTAGALIVLVVALTLQFAEYVPNQPLNERADLGLRLCLAVLPALAFGAAALLLKPKPS
ncbi:MAG: MFS transporter [Pseudomonadales bacterium]